MVDSEFIMDICKSVKNKFDKFEKVMENPENVEASS